MASYTVGSLVSFPRAPKRPNLSRKCYGNIPLDMRPISDYVLTPERSSSAFLAKLPGRSLSLEPIRSNVIDLGSPMQKGER